MLSELLELRSGGAAPPTAPAARGFLPLLACSEDAFEELFVLSYRVLDAEWLAQGASYMQARLDHLPGYQWSRVWVSLSCVSSFRGCWGGRSV
jgi:hypothetical protein